MRPRPYFRPPVRRGLRARLLERLHNCNAEEAAREIAAYEAACERRMDEERERDPRDRDDDW